MFRMYELKAIYGSVKSYYGKATVKEFDGFKVLQSYDTDVCYLNGNGDFFRTWNGYSPTTARHIDEFRKQNGLPGICKKEWDKLDVMKPLSPIKTVIIDYFKWGA